MILKLDSIDSKVFMPVPCKTDMVMDVLKPELIWINKRCYRVNPNSNLVPSVKNEPAHKGYVEEDLYSDEEREEDKEILLKNGQYELSFHVPSMFYSHIIGAKGLTKKRVESETGTRITVPRPGATGNINIMGKTRNAVSSAGRKLNLIVLAARSKIPSTHFICVPFNSAPIKETYIKLKDEINRNGLMNFDESFFQKPEKLHITVAMLSLLDNEDRLAAAQILNECKDTFIKQVLEENKGKIMLQLKGLEIMNDDPSAAHILYAIVKSDVLQHIADGIVDYFSRSNLTQKETGKLHVTLITSKPDQSDGMDSKERVSFDARGILENFKNYDFGTHILDEIHLSQRYSTGTDGFYEATAILNLGK